MTPEEQRMLIEVHAVVVGVNGNDGLMKQMNKQGDKINAFCSELQLHQALPAHEGAAKDIKEIKEAVDRLERKPLIVAKDAWKWVAGVIATILITTGVTILFNWSEHHAQPKPAATSTKTPGVP